MWDLAKRVHSDMPKRAKHGSAFHSQFSRAAFLLVDRWAFCGYGPFQQSRTAKPMTEYTHMLPCPKSKQVVLTERICFLVKSYCPKGVKELGESDCPQIIAYPALSHTFPY